MHFRDNHAYFSKWWQKLGTGPFVLFFSEEELYTQEYFKTLKKINIFAILFILKGLRRHHWYRRHTWQTVLRQLRMLSGKNFARANGDHDKHGKFTYKQPEGIWQYTNDARLQVEHSNMLSRGWHVITRAQPEWWHFNRWTTYLNVPRASVLHLFCRMTNYEQVQNPGAVCMTRS